MLPKMWSRFLLCLHMVGPCHDHFESLLQNQNYFYAQVTFPLSKQDCCGMFHLWLLQHGLCSPSPWPACRSSEIGALPPEPGCHWDLGFFCINSRFLYRRIFVTRDYLRFFVPTCIFLVSTSNCSCSFLLHFFSFRNRRRYRSANIY